MPPRQLPPTPPPASAGCSGWKARNRTPLSLTPLLCALPALPKLACRYKRVCGRAEGQVAPQSPGAAALCRAQSPLPPPQPPLRRAIIERGSPREAA